MRKPAAIFVSLIYLLLSAGFSVNMHYCQGHLESVSLFIDADSCCCAGNIPTSNCCSNQELVVQLYIQDQLVQNSIILSKVYDYILMEQPLMHKCAFNIAEMNNFNFTGLPPPPKQPIWKTNCAFLFYG